ncbi:MAG TPA: cytochrome o ubiquinol oxidase subunit III [Candidatus Paceibacterota bacterium]
MTVLNEQQEAEENAADGTTVFGLWVYLMTDLVLFASLFAAYAVLHTSTFGGPSGRDIFDLPLVLAETLLLLTSSFTCGLALLAARAGSARGAVNWLGATFLLGAAFLAIEFSEFARLAGAGNGPPRSAFLSSYFTLVGTHGLHIVAGLLWIAALIFAVLRRGLSRSSLRKLMLFSMFWHFLDLVWIFIFTVVYLMGANLL